MITLKMVDQRWPKFCLDFTISLCALELKQTLVTFVFETILLSIVYMCCQKLFEVNL